MPAALETLERDGLFRAQLGDLFVDYFLKLKRSETGRFADWLKDNGWYTETHHSTSLANLDMENDRENNFVWGDDLQKLRPGFTPHNLHIDLDQRPPGVESVMASAAR